MKIFIDITDPKLVQIKSGRKIKNVRPGAPPPMIGRFGVHFGVDTKTSFEDPNGYLLSWRFDGNLLIYVPEDDDCVWLPARTFYGRAYKNISHPSAMMIETVSRALGFPKFNPGWDQDGSTDPQAVAARDRVARGLYMKVINAAREWRREWVDESVVAAPSAVPAIIEEVGEFVDGVD